MSYAWLMALHEYEPNYDAYINDMYSLEDAMIDVATYDDWFPELSEKSIQASDKGGAWSFDDYNIGKRKRGGHVLFSHEIKRPLGLSNSDWYVFAGAVIKVLNHKVPILKSQI